MDYGIKKHIFIVLGIALVLLSVRIMRIHMYSDRVVDDYATEGARMLEQKIAGAWMESIQADSRKFSCSMNYYGDRIFRITITPSWRDEDEGIWEEEDYVEAEGRWWVAQGYIHYDIEYSDDEEVFAVGKYQEKFGFPGKDLLQYEKEPSTAGFSWKTSGRRIRSVY